METLEALSGSVIASSKFIDGRIKGVFVTYVFNLSQKTLSPSEITVLEKGLGFSLMPSSINEEDLPRDIYNFSRQMSCKRFFRNESQKNAGETSEFQSKSTWNPPKGAPALKQFFSQTEIDISSILPRIATNYILSTLQCLVCKMTKVLLLNQQTRGSELINQFGAELII